MLRVPKSATQKQALWDLRVSGGVSELFRSLVLEKQALLGPGI